MSVEILIDGLRVLRADNEISEEFYSKLVAALKAGKDLAKAAKLVADAQLEVGPYRYEYLGPEIDKLRLALEKFKEDV